MSDGYEVVGAYGEIVWARMHGLPDPEQFGDGGDGGRDFLHQVRTDTGGVKPISVDIKTARKAYNLLVPVGDVRADVYVLAAYVETARQSPRIKFVGWELSSAITRAPSRKFHERGQLNHFISASALRPMNSLERRIVGHMTPKLTVDEASEIRQLRGHEWR